MRAKFGVLEQTHDLRYMPNFVSIGLFSRPVAAKNPKILSLFDFGIAIWQQSVKFGHGCTSTNLPLYNGIKIVSVLQRLHGEIVRRMSVVQERHTGFTIFIISSIIIANSTDVISS